MIEENNPTEEIKPIKNKSRMTDEHKMKLSNARDKYWKKIREMKALAPEIQKLSSDLNDHIGKGKLIEPAEAREHVIRKIFSKKDKILDAQIDAATGIWTCMDGKRVYQKAPNVSSGEYLINQLIGKATESMEVKQITKILVDL